MQKTAKSDANFKNTRVTTGERIFVKNGKAVAIGFKTPILDLLRTRRRLEKLPQALSKYLFMQIFEAERQHCRLILI